MQYIVKKKKRSLHDLTLMVILRLDSRKKMFCHVVVSHDNRELSVLEQ